MKRSLQRTLRTVPVLGILFLFIACGPEKRIQWTPDGTRAAVISSEKLYLADAGGNLSAPLADHVERVAWLPDSRRFAMVTSQEIDSWDELVRIAPADLSPNRIVQIATAAREEFVSYNGKLDDFKPANHLALTQQQWIAAILYLKKESDPRFVRKMGEEWKEIAETKADVRTLRIATASPEASPSSPALLVTLEEIDEIRVAGDGDALAIVTRVTPGWESEEDRTILVVPASAAGKPLVAAEHVSAFPDWSPDGRDIVYVRRGRPDTNDLGSLCRRAVRNQEGAVLAELAEPTELARVSFDHNARVRCLKDGRILFSAEETALPAIIPGPQARTTLFLLEPGRNGLRRVLPRGADDDPGGNAGWFELSPDETRAAVLSGKSRVSIVSLATGESTRVMDAGAEQLETLPVWRNAEQLCVVAPGGSALAPGRKEVLLWSGRKSLSISRGWSEEVLAGLK